MRFRVRRGGGGLRHRSAEPRARAGVKVADPDAGPVRPPGLAASAHVLAVQYPGRQDRWDEPMPDLHTLADRIAGELSAHQVPDPVFFGHSMGAVVAYEVALRLGPFGPSVLVVSGSCAPSRYRHGSVHTRDDDELVRHLAALGGTSAELLAASSQSADKDPMSQVKMGFAGASAACWAVSARTAGPRRSRGPRRICPRAPTPHAPV